MSGKRVSGKNYSSKKVIIYGLIGIIAIVVIAAISLGMPANNPTTAIDTSKQDSIKLFQTQFCGNDSRPQSNQFISEYKLQDSCEMPLGISSSNGTIWYISTKHGKIGDYDIASQKFGTGKLVPEWKVRSLPTDYSMSWTLKEDSSGHLWFTDQKQNLIWRFDKASQAFDKFVSPASYPAALDFDTKGNIYFVGIRSNSLFFGDVSKMKNGTSQGIVEIPLPMQAFAGIDPEAIGTGSLSVDNERKVVWISMLAFDKKGLIYRYHIESGKVDSFNLPEELKSPVGIVVDNNGNPWITDHGTSIFFMLDPNTKNIIKYVTSPASPRIFGGRQMANAYTLPYWIEKSTDGSIWFNEHTGNKIAKFDPQNQTLVEYWIPTQNRLFGSCPPDSNTCGIANALQISADTSGRVWFSEWSENKIGAVDTNKPLPFLISFTQNNITSNREQSTEIKVNVTALQDTNIDMVSSISSTPTGSLGNSTGSFSENPFPLKAGQSKQISFIFTPGDMQPGKNTLMIGADNGYISILKALNLNIL